MISDEQTNEESQDIATELPEEETVINNENIAPIDEEVENNVQQETA